jgi:hypothetical protein
MLEGMGDRKPQNYGWCATPKALGEESLFEGGEASLGSVEVVPI